jgi:hypothetical protein
MHALRVLGYSTKIRVRRQFNERFISQPVSHPKKPDLTSGFFKFRFFLLTARLASDRLTAALHKPAGTSCREKVVSENVNASEAKRNTAPSDIVRRRLRPDRR